MTPSIRPVLALALACVLAACQREAAPPPAAAPSAAPAPAPAAPPAVAPPATAATANAEGVGVADCDDYLARYEACLAGKVPDSVKPTLQQSLAQTRAAWKAAAATAAGRQELAAACQQARDASRRMLQQYGCSDF